MKTPILMTALLAGGALSAVAGSAAVPSHSQSEAEQSKKSLSEMSFEEFAATVDDDFRSFRSEVLENYAKFLDGEWVAFTPKMILKNERPKLPEPVAKDPAEAPQPSAKPKPIKPTARPDIAGVSAPEPRPLLQRKPTPAPLPEGARPDLGNVGASSPEGKLLPKPTPAPMPEGARPDLGRLGANTPGGELAAKPTPIPEFYPEIPDGPQDEFELYGMPLMVPKIDFKITENVATAGDMAHHWRTLDANPAVMEAARALEEKGSAMGFNGYLVYELMWAYAKDKFPAAGDASRMSLVHYMLANLGYDVRLGLTGAGLPILLMPFDSTVYGQLLLNIQGKNYTALLPDHKDPNSVGNQIYTANLPNGADLGHASTLRLNGLVLPEKPYSFEVEAGPLRLSGTLNENLFPLLYRYPQMPTEGYASSMLMPDLRTSLAEQVKEQLGEMSDKEAVNGMLKFFHEGFEYATDDANHGFEKPYFLEETFYYPQCDCEDRAIALTYLLWEGLGLRNQLIAYPGHESAAVSLSEPVNGTAYTSGGNTYYSCDPTYIGSSVGDCMPQFRHETPTVDKTYPQ